MILVDKRGKLYRCGTASLADLDDQHQGTVHSKDDVLAFLKNHPDEHFFLKCDGEPTHQATADDEQHAVFCGLVRWKAKEKQLQNRSLSFPG
jgi:hypothetical protein